MPAARAARCTTQALNGAGVARAGSGTSVAVTFINNWWGVGDGPGGSGGGSGDSIPGALDYQPFLTEPPAHCGGPALSLMPGIWDFGDVQAGDSALSDPFVVDNTGGSNLVVGMVAIEGPAAGDFQLEDDICSGQTVAPGGFSGFSVRFTPTVAGIRRAEVRVLGNAPESPAVAVLIGTQDVVFFDGFEGN